MELNVERKLKRTVAGALDSANKTIGCTAEAIEQTKRAWFLWTWMRGVARMDELERRIELEALAFAFPVSIVFFATLGLLDVAVTLDPNDFSLRNVWLMMPMLYYIGLWRAQRRYR